jgi:cytochrome c oxidase subunit IV
MIFGFVILLTALTLSVVAAFYSISGLVAIFAAAPIPIMIMGGALEIAKVVTTVFLHNNWKRLGMAYKTYLVPAVAILMFLTSIGIFGLLSKAHSDQTLVSGDVQSKISIYDEKIKISRDNIDANRRALKQMDEAVDQVMARSTTEGGADKAVAIRRSQSKERDRLVKEIDQEQKKITSINEERAPIAAEIRKVEADVGPIRYISALIYGDNPDANLLERAVRWVIILIVIVFDPLALCLILSANKQFEWALKGEGGWVHDQPKEQKETSTFTSPVDTLEPVFEREEIPDLTDYTEGTLIATQNPPSGHIPDPEPEEDVPVAKTPPRFSGFSFPMSSVFGKPKEEIVEKPVAEEPMEFEPLIEKPVPRPENPEAAPGLNRGVMHTHLVKADKTILSGRASHSDFGNEFPANPSKGDTYLRTDYLPNRLFKFNDFKWIEIDKDSTDVYAYEEAYIQHLINEIAAGRYDPDSLTDVEREQIADYLGKNAQ